MHKRNNSGGGGKMRHNRNRGYQNRGGGNRGGGNDGNNIQRQKHHATQMREKYNGLARDAQMNGDVVDMEYYLQHVDHYGRVLADIAVIEGERFAAREAEQAERAAQQQAEGGQQAQQQEGGEQQEGEQQQAQQSQDGGDRNRNRGYRPRNPHDRGGHTNPNANHEEIPLPSSVIPEITQNG